MVHSVCLWGEKKTDNVLPSNINSFRLFWVVNQPQWLVDRPDFARAPALMCPPGFAASLQKPRKLRGLRRFSHRCFSEATVFLSLSSLKTFFHKSSGSPNQESPLSRRAGTFTPDQSCSHVHGIRIICKIWKEITDAQSPPQTYPIRIWGAGPRYLYFWQASHLFPMSIKDGETLASGHATISWYQSAKF